MSHLAPTFRTSSRTSLSGKGAFGRGGHSSKMRARDDIHPASALAVLLTLCGAVLWTSQAQAAPPSISVAEDAGHNVVVTVKGDRAPTFQIYEARAQPGAAPRFVIELPGSTVDAKAPIAQAPAVVFQSAVAYSARARSAPRLELSFFSGVDYDAKTNGNALVVTFVPVDDAATLIANFKARKAKREADRLASKRAEAEQKRAAEEAKGRAERERIRVAALEQQRKEAAAREAERVLREQQAREEAARLAAAEQKRLKEEREKKKRALVAEQKRKAEEAERKRLAAIAAEKERQRLAAIAAEKERQRLAALAAEQERQRQAALAAEKKRKEEAAEKERLAKLEAKRKREEAARLAKLEEEQRRKAAEAKRLAKIETERKKKEAEAARLAKLEQERLEREAKAKQVAELERQRLAEQERQQKAEAERLALEAKQEQARLAKIEAERRQKALELKRRKEALAAKRAQEQEQQRRLAEQRRQQQARAEADRQRQAQLEQQKRVQRDRLAEERRRQARAVDARGGSSNGRRIEVANANRQGFGFGGTRSVDLGRRGGLYQLERAPRVREDAFGGGSDDSDGPIGILCRVTVRRQARDKSAVGIRVDGGARYAVSRRSTNELVLTLFDTRAQSLTVRRILDARDLRTSILRVLPHVEEDVRNRVELVIELRGSGAARVTEEDEMLWLHVES